MTRSDVVMSGASPRLMKPGRQAIVSLFVGLSLSLTLLLAVGCKTIRSIEDQPQMSGRPLSLTAEEADAFAQQAWALYNRQPRTVARVIAASQRLQRCAAIRPEDYALQVQAAEALAFVATYDSRHTVCEQASRQGIILARRAMDLHPDHVAGHYWYAILVGLLADRDRAYGADAVVEMEQALRSAIRIDESYDRCGPLRLLGILHLRTPPPPIGIGSSRQALRLLEQAATQCPDYPENYLYLAELEFVRGDQEQAIQHLDRVLESEPVPGLEFETIHWQDTARILKAKWKP